MGLKQFLKKKRELIFLILIFIILELILLPKFNFLYWDEAVYLAIGKYIYSAGNSGFLEIIRPLGLSLLIGWLWLLKLNYIILSKIVMIILSAIYLAASYFLSIKIFNKKIAIITTALLIITPVFFGFSTLVMTGVPATLFIMLALYFYIKKNNLFLSGLFTALAFSFRFPAGLVLVIISASIFLRYLQGKRKNFSLLIKKYLIYFFSFILFVLPYILFNYFKYHKVTSYLHHALFRPWIMSLWHQYNPAAMVITDTLLSKIYNLFYYPVNLFLHNIFFIFVIVAIVLWIKNKQYKNFKFNTILIAFFIFLIYFSYILNKQVRFSLMFLPFTAMLSAYGIFNVYKFIKKRLKKNFTTFIIVILCFAQFYAIMQIYEDNNIEYILTRPKPKLYTSLTEFFVSNKINNDIVSTDPLAAVYIDNRFIPNFYSFDILVSDFESNKTVTTLIYYPKGVWCAEHDSRCVTDRKRIAQYFMENYNLVFFDPETELYVFSKNFSLPTLNKEQLQKTKIELLMSPNAVDSIVVFRIENAGSLYREDKKGNIWHFEKFKTLNSIFNDTKVTWSIIPADILGLNEKSKGYLEDYVSNKSIVIAQKGYEHKDNGLGSEFRGLSYSKQLDKIRKGKEILEREFGQKITVFIPPFNSADENTIKALDTLNYTVYSSTAGDFLYFKDTNLNRYDQLISFTDWQNGKNLDFDTLKAQFDSLNRFKDYIIITIEYYTLSEDDFDTLKKFLNYIKSRNIEIMDLKELDEWYRFRDSVNFLIENKVVQLYANPDKLSESLTMSFYFSSNFTFESNLKSVQLINLNDKNIDVCLNSKCYKLKPNRVRIVEVENPQ